jgi:hypothetical protein
MCSPARAAEIHHQRFRTDVSVTVHTKGWSREALLASQVWFGIDSCTRMLYKRDFGIEELLELEFTFMRKHQETHFIDGAKKLGIFDWPHARLAAAYHCLSNMVGGLETGYLEDGDRAWIFYYPPLAYAGSPTLATPMAAAVDLDVLYANLRAWHANNGILLGNPRLRVVVTDLILNGGPFDALYFEEADHDLAEEERLVIDYSIESPLPGPVPAWAEEAWPEERRSAALRKYNAEYAVGGFAQIEVLKGKVVAADMAEKSFGMNFVSWSRALLGEFELDKERDPVRRVASLFRQTFGIIGDEFSELESDGSILLDHGFSRLSVPQFDGWATVPHYIEDAIARAWTTVARAVDADVVVSVDRSRSDGEVSTLWRFASRT